VWLAGNSVLYRTFLEYTAAKAAGINATAPAGRTAPTSTLRSAGPGSPESWNSLGRNGQAFVADGSTVTGKHAMLVLVLASNCPITATLRELTGNADFSK